MKIILPSRFYILHTHPVTPWSKKLPTLHIYALNYFWQNFCKAVAALLHFFVLSAFGWMLCEGILLYILLIKIFDGFRGRHWKIFNFIGWGKYFLLSIKEKYNRSTLCRTHLSRTRRRFVELKCFAFRFRCVSVFITLKMSNSTQNRHWKSHLLLIKISF